MSESQGAMSIAEGNYDYRVDVNLVLDGGKKLKNTSCVQHWTVLA